jgi:phage terminase large subunit-like protein
MVAADDYLLSLIHIQIHLKKITNRKTGATLQVKSFDPKVLTGVKPSGVLLDELHVVSSNNNADRVIGQLRGGLISQPEGFLAFITTQSERPPSGVFLAELTKARRIRDGEITGSGMLPVLYEFPDDVDWRDKSKWWMITPNRNLSVYIERLVEEYETAVDTGEEELRRWASQHLNVQIGLALRMDRWAGADFWEVCADADLTLDTIVERSEVIVVGVDGGGLDDLLAMAVIGRDKETHNWLMWAHAWAHECVLEKRKSEVGKLRSRNINA